MKFKNLKEYRYVVQLKHAINLTLVLTTVYRSTVQ